MNINLVAKKSLEQKSVVQHAVALLTERGRPRPPALMIITLLLQQKKRSLIHLKKALPVNQRWRARTTALRQKSYRVTNDELLFKTSYELTSVGLRRA